MSIMNVDISKGTLFIIFLYALITSYFIYLGVVAYLENEQDKKEDKAKAIGNFWTDGGRHGRPDNTLAAGSLCTHDGSRYVPSHGGPAFRP
jgi:hypothetical protein